MAIPVLFGPSPRNSNGSGHTESTRHHRHPVLLCKYCERQSLQQTYSMFFFRVGFAQKAIRSTDSSTNGFPHVEEWRGGSCVADNPLKYLWGPKSHDGPSPGRKKTCWEGLF